jgi:hypothetical protein
MRRPLSKENKKVSILCFNWSNTILATLRQQLYKMANGMVMVMANGNVNCDPLKDKFRIWQNYFCLQIKLIYILHK